MHVFGIPVGREKVRRDPTVHGTPDFPMAMYDTIFDDDLFGFVQWHWHEELQFCVVTKGAFTFSVNETNFAVREGQGIFINSGCLHMAQPVEVPGGIYICLNLNPKLLTFFPSSAVDAKFVQPFLYSSNLRSVFLTGEKPWQREILTKILVMHELFAKGDYGLELDLCIEMSLIWRIMVQNLLSLAETRGHGKMDYQKMKALLSHIHDHYMEKITLADLARLVDLSVSECCRFFKRVTNCTIVEYLTDYRLRLSLDLLQFSDMSISDIAYEVGFGSASYFVDRFRKNMGIVPTEYRKKMRARRNRMQEDKDAPVISRQNVGVYSLARVSAKSKRG